MHPFFYNPALGIVIEDNLPGGSLSIGHDAWLGERAIVAPGCKRIGLGAVVGAGSVVTTDVPDFAIVGGNPARLIRYRFSEAIRDVIRISRWWERTVEECREVLPDMVRALPADPWMHPLLRTGKDGK